MPSVYAQEVQNGYSYRNVQADRYFRFSYENDLFFHTDYYFSQGLHFELVSPALSKFLTRPILLHPKGSYTRFGLALESAGYTPTDIKTDTILYGDRPFSGMAYLKAFSIAINEAKQTRYTSTLTLGWMGPAAIGYEIQTAIHKRTGSDTPGKGWNYQIGNSVILNYELNYERSLLASKKALLTATAMLRAGTYTTKASLGSVIMLGLFDNPFKITAPRSKLQAYLFAHPRVDIVGYDATLQGGLFTDNSPYTIAAADVSRLVFRCDGGIRFNYHGFFISAYARYLTKEFSTGIDHSIGGFELAFTL
jgi:lipid A 3-O-deacylase